MKFKADGHLGKNNIINNLSEYLGAIERKYEGDGFSTRKIKLNIGKNMMRFSKEVFQKDCRERLVGHAGYNLGKISEKSWMGEGKLTYLKEIPLKDVMDCIANIMDEKKTEIEECLKSVK